MYQHLSIDATVAGLAASPFGGTLLLGALIGLAVLLVWFPPPVFGTLRRLLARPSPAPERVAAQRQNSTL